MVQFSSPWETHSSVKVEEYVFRSRNQWSQNEPQLSATAATEMFRQGGPEKLIQERTGHRSLEALRSYERLDEVQHKAVSSLLSTAPGKSRSVTYSEHLLSTKTHSFGAPSTSYAPPVPAITLQNLHGCTINFNCAAIPTTIPPQLGQDTTFTDTELDELFTLVDM